MKTINNSIKGKICVLGGSFEATRLVPYFNKKPKTAEKVTIKIMANYVYSLKGIFSRDSVKPYLKNFKVKLITNNSFQIDNDEIDYMKEVMGDDFEYKCIENVWSNMFLKEGSPCVTLDLYGFGYNPYSYHGNSIEESNRGLCIKIDNKNISQELSDWFDLIWENEKMISLSSIIVKSKDISKIVGKDGGGRMFSFANVEFSNVIDSNQSILEIDFSKFILKDVNSAFIPTKAKLVFYDEKVVLSYNDETNENLCVTFFACFALKSTPISSTSLNI